MKSLHGLACCLVIALIALSGCSGESTDESRKPQQASEAPASVARENPTAGKIEHVTTEAEGRGPTLNAAVDQAILIAIQQVNGKTMDASSMQFSGGVALSVGEDKLDIGSSAFAELVATRTRGAVTDFKMLSRKDLEGGDVAVTIQASVAKFQKPASAALLKVVVAPFRSDASSFVIDESNIPADRVIQELRQSIVNSLVQTRRVSVIDREFTDEVQGELELIESGRMATEEFARLGEQLLADYLLVGRVEEFGYQRHERQLRTSERTVVSHSGGARLSIRLINVTTGQVELSDTVEVELPQTAATTLGTAVSVEQVSNSLINGLGGSARDAIVSRLFPVTVVAVDGDEVVLSQGGQALRKGAYYEVMLRGKELTDPQTGQVIGRVEKRCCTIVVTRVSDDLSFGQVTDSSVKLSEVFAPGALEVRGLATPPTGTADQGVAISTAPAADSPAAPVVQNSLQAGGQPQVEEGKEKKEDKDW